jgi:hypothetical protein
VVTVLICHAPRGAMSEGLLILLPSLEKRLDKTFIAGGDRPDDCELHRESISAL